MTSMKSDDYNVGYRKPPKAGRFRKGQSGNPKGRKSSSENFQAIFKRQVMRRIRLTGSDGTSRTLTVAEAVFAKNYQAAIKGDQTAMDNMLKLAEFAGEFRDRNDPKVTGGNIFMPERCTTTDEFLAEYGAGIVKVGGHQTDG